MGRHSHSQTLTLWANGEYVGRWTITARGDMELQYDAGWPASPRGRPISLSLPFNLNNEPRRKCIGVAQGQFEVPDDIDASDGDVTRLFLG